ncbi:MAG: hypothetical protein HY533_01835 [Chloroflexi bacterium]|nr:hypothetical protein [Chloroflexota bacterium]
MARTYRAILHGDRIEWIADRPHRSEGVEVRVTLAEGEEPYLDHSQGAAMAEILAELAQRGAFSAIPDPVAWQREQRQDHPLARPDE